MNLKKIDYLKRDVRAVKIYVPILVPKKHVFPKKEKRK